MSDKPAKKSFVVYSVATTMAQDKTYSSRYAAEQLAKKLTAKKVGSLESSVGYLEGEKAKLANAGDPFKSVAKVDKLLDLLKAGTFYAVTDYSDYNENVVYQTLQTNLMSKEDYWEPSNTPGYCSPSRESYWSM